MENQTLNQAYLFLIFILNGAFIGFIFDIFRIIRRSFKTNDIMTYLQDLIFWIIAGSTVLYSIFIFNQGEIRFYIFIGLLLGIILYILLLSKIFIKISVNIILFIKNIVYKILYVVFTPIRIVLNILRRILLKPISFIFINIRKISTKSILMFTNKIKKDKNIIKNSTQ